MAEHLHDGDRHLLAVAVAGQHDGRADARGCGPDLRRCVRAGATGGRAGRARGRQLVLGGAGYRGRGDDDDDQGAHAEEHDPERVTATPAGRLARRPVPRRVRLVRRLTLIRLLLPWTLSLASSGPSLLIS